MKAGKHVISAVPACISIEQAEDLLAAQKQTGMTYMMAETSYYHPVLISARKLYEEGAFGEVFRVVALRVGERTPINQTLGLTVHC
jgi:predicted dehydrogenase